jgi:hypothetical protein
LIFFIKEKQKNSVIPNLVKIAAIDYTIQRCIDFDNNWSCCMTNEVVLLLFLKTGTQQEINSTSFFI